MDGKPLCLEIRNATSGADLDEVRALLRDYNTFLAVSTAPGELDLDGRMAELASLPGTNAPPSGALLLALLEGEPAGCVALGPMTLPSGEIVAELRRLWVSPRFRGHALGRALLTEAASCARSAGHRAIISTACVA